MSVGVRAAILALSFLLAGCIGPEGTEILGTEYRNPCLLYTSDAADE